MKANASVSSIYTQKRLEKELKRIGEMIDRCHAALDEQDAVEDECGAAADLSDPDLQRKLGKLKERQAKCRTLQKRMEEAGDTQVSAVDADARMLRKNGKTVGGYNVQSAVDEKNKLIVAAEATRDGNDFGQLAPMMEAAAEATGAEALEGLADS